MAPPALAALHMDPPAPVPGRGEGILLEDLPTAAVDAFLAVAGPAASCPLLSVELRHLGGALTPGRSSGGAVAGLPGAFLLFGVGMAPTPEIGIAVGAALERVLAALEPWHGSSTTNFAERGREAEELFGSACTDLRRVASAYDPDDVVRAQHPVTPHRSAP